MLTITDLAQEQRIQPIWRQAFRPLFLFGALFAVLAVAYWIATIIFQLRLPHYGGAMFWHAHEMLYGFVVAIILGFLLTAVQNWTAIRGIYGKPLIFLVALWGLGRLLMLVELESLQWLAAIVDFALLPIACVILARPIVVRKQWRNLVFVPILTLLAINNALMHISVLAEINGLYQQAAFTTVLLISLLITIIGGRVIPMFTANGVGFSKPQPIRGLERSVIVATGAIFVLFFLRLDRLLADSYIALIFALTALLHLFRMLRWKPWCTVKHPLVWSLHAGYGFLVIGFALLAIHWQWHLFTRSTAMHALTVGAMGVMILAMLTRVSLGHSGRPLVAPKLLGGFLLCAIFAALLRTIMLAIYPQYSLWWIASAALLWCIAFSGYLLRYTKILTAPRADGHPG